MPKKIGLLTMGGLILGIGSGLLIPEVMKNLAFIGTIYLNLLKFMIAPIMMTNLIVTFYQLPKSGFRLLGKTILLFGLMFSLTFGLMVLIFKGLQVGVGYQEVILPWSGEIAKFNFGSVITQLFPSNMITLISGNSLLGLILFAMVFGISARKVPNSNQIIKLIANLGQIFNRIWELIMSLTPLAVWALIGIAVANYGSLLLEAGFQYILIATLGGLLTLLFIMLLPVWVIAKINPIVYLKKLFPVWIMSLTTCSSLATLPTTIKVCCDDFHLSKKITNLVVPLGCTINMCGGALSFALLGVFCCHMHGIEINLMRYLIMLGVALLLNMAAPGIPGGGILLGATYLSLLKIPMTLMGLYSAIYRILDMNYTTLNVTGDVSAVILVDKWVRSDSPLKT